MAIYHFSAQVLGRAPKWQKDGTRRPGSNAVAAAAYRSGERLSFAGREYADDGETVRVPGRVHDYSKRKGVSHSEVMVPAGAASWLADRELLWNTVEAMEVRKDAQLAREFNIALPHELSHGERLELVREYVFENFVSRGMVADIALHDPDPDKGMSEKNFHAHVMVTMRTATEKGLNPVKTRAWNSKDLLQEWRSNWSAACNEALLKSGRKVRIDHRTLVVQRHDALRRGDAIAAGQLNRRPEVHQGPRGRQAIRRGYQVRSGRRQVGPRWHRVRWPDGTVEIVQGRRVVDTRRFDKGTRLSWFDQVLAGNNDQLRKDLEKFDRLAARMQRKWLYWTRQVEHWTEGQVRGKQFRFDRWKVAQEERERKAKAARRRAHAIKRRDQAAAIKRMLEDALSGSRIARERALVRARDIRAWLEKRIDAGRDRTRGRQREP